MPNYTVMVNDEQQFALEYETERRNAMQAAMSGPGAGTGATTPAEVLQHIAAQHLDMLGMQAQEVAGPLVTMLATQEPGGREALIQQLPRTSLQNYLRVVGRR